MKDANLRERLEIHGTRCGCWLASVLAAGAGVVIWLADRRGREAAVRREATEREIGVARSLDAVLEAYLDRVADLLKEGLREAKPGDGLRSIARARTVTALRQLDGERNRLLLQFLHEVGLMEWWSAGKREGRAVILLSGADLHGADLHGADLRGAYLNKAILSGADLRGADLRGADLRGAHLDLADLSDANLNAADLQGAFLNGANLQKACLVVADLRRAYLSKANLRDADLNLADLREAGLRGANLREADVSEARLEGADLREADLREAFMELANLDKVDLNGADLRGAALSWANVSDRQLARAASLEGATLPDGTQSTSQRFIPPAPEDAGRRDVPAADGGHDSTVP